MAVNNKEISSAKKGMNRDALPFELGKEEYSFALNVNFHDEHGNGSIVLQNEPSNIKCSGFKPGYKVVGHRYDINADVTYFMLTNPTTGFSEIGYINTFLEVSDVSPVEQNNNGDITVIVETPLEDTVQVAICNYTTLLSDKCPSGSQTGSKCLNFSVDAPIHENNIHIKYGKRGKTLWFNHLRNPPRYIELDNLDQYTSNTDPCTDIQTDICLDCEKMRVFPLYEIPCLLPAKLVNGGNLRAGVNEGLIAYCDAEGNELSNYYSITNPIPIFDVNNNVLDQTTLDYQTNQAIVLDIAGLDLSFEFFKIVVLHRNGLDGAMSVYQNGIYPTNQVSVTISNLQDKKKLSLEDVIARRPFYDKAKGSEVANGYIYHYGLKTQRVINLQPVVNLMGALAKWATYQAKEDLYENGVNVAKYASVMRDEVYPYGIKFLMSGGAETNLFPLIARPPKPEEIEELGTSDFPTNSETASVLEYNPECYGNNRKYRWQFENTAEETDVCLVEAEGISTDTIVQETESSCYVVDGDSGEILPVDAIVNSQLIVDSNVDIITYINTHRDEILASTGDNGEDIREILDNPADYPETCTPVFEDTCSDVITLVSEEIFPLSVGTESTDVVEKLPADYTPSSPVSNPCAIYALDSTGNPQEDTTFETAYMLPGETVLKRLPNPNVTCSLAGSVIDYSTPQIDNGQHLANKGEVTTITTLQNSLVASQTQTKVEIALTGTHGSAHININGTNYTITFTTNLTITANNFVSAWAAAILADTGCLVTSVGNIIQVSGYYAGFLETPVTHISGDLAGFYDNETYTDRIHTNVIWFKVPFGGATKKVFELGNIACVNGDDNNGNSLRINVFANCGATGDLTAYSRIVSDISTTGGEDKFVILDSADFGGPSGTAYIALDSPIRTRKVSAQVVNTLTPPCDCFPVYRRDVETSIIITYSNLTFGKKQTYRTECEYTVANLNNCEAVPYKKGIFSYVESEEVYPCNKELYDSSTLKIKPADLATIIRTEFEDYYVVGGSSAPTFDGFGNYILVPEADFRDKPIRHYKYPDNTVSPFMSATANNPGKFKPSIIYPIGFNLTSDTVNDFLDIAVNNGLLSEEERSRITSFELYRGDRRVQKSVVAKGLLFDMYKYRETGDNPEDVYYANYPLNSLGTDQFNGDVPHPYNSTNNNFFAFHSPDTSFGRPTLPREIRVEGYVYGDSANYYDEVRNHPTYVILGKTSLFLAGSLAYAEIAFEILLQTSDLLVSGLAGGVSSPASTAAAVAAIVSILGTAFFKYGEYQYQWTRTLKDLGKPTNFAYYQASIGYYNVFKPNEEDNQILRGLTLATYLKDGNWSVVNENSHEAYNINSLDRENSVLLHLGDYPVTYPTEYQGYDNTDLLPFSASRKKSPLTTGKTTSISGRAASPYVAIKQYLPSQYGEINSVTWLNTGYCGNLAGSSDCDAAFGGDITISRFALKRKLPFFRTTAFGLAPLTPYKYSDSFNINPPAVGTDPGSRLYIDYEVNDDSFNFTQMFLFPGQNSKYNLDAGGTDITGMYVKTPNKFYLYSYGIPHFLVESEINCNFRYAKREAHENFYPNVQDVVEWTQEKNVSIRQPNTYFYNSVYSAGHSLYPYSMLPYIYEREVYDKLNNLSNDIIYSAQDLSERSFYDPWLRYKALDTYSFSSTVGELVSVKALESQQIMARFTNGFTIFGSIDQIRDRLTPETQNLGNGGIFAGRPIDFNITDIGYAGTQHNSMVSCEFGHFSVDAKRGKVFQLMPNGKGVKEISKGSDMINNSLEKWFKTNLPFKILQAFPTINIDNAMNRVGITMGWDDRTKRVFITKKDYRVINPSLFFQEGIGFYIKNPEDADETIEITLGDPEYFINCSWTVAYSPTIGTWISYYSFLPNYYLGYNDYFQTGVNTHIDATEIGLWSHLPNLSSYQVFYGKLYPFIIEYPIVNKLSNSKLNYVEYWLEARKYYNSHNFSEAYGIGFNKAVVYNAYQNTGILNLVHQKDDDLSQSILYPKHNPTSVDILQTEINGKWTFNHLYNAVKNEKSGMPLWREDCPQILKTIDDRLLNYSYTYKDYMRGDSFLVRLINDVESRYKLLFRWAVDDRNFYNQ